MKIEVVKTNTCHWCKKLQDENSSIENIIFRNVTLKDKSMYGVSKYPTTLFFADSGQYLGNIVGYFEKPTFLKKIEDFKKLETLLNNAKNS
jgi:thioredoxin-related protein